MYDSREELIKQISKANVMRRHCDRIADKIKRTKDNWFDKLQGKLEVLNRKARTGEGKKQGAYLKLVGRKKLLQR